MIAIVKNVKFHKPRQPALDRHCVLEIALVIVARVEHQRMLLHLIEERLDVANQLAEFKHEATTAPEEIFDRVAVALQRIHDEAA